MSEIHTVADGDLEFHLRPYQEEDLRLVYSSWMGALKGARPVKSWPARLRQRHRATVLPALVEAHGVLCAVNLDNPLLVLGWACGSPGLLHWVGVKQRYQRLGLATYLVERVCGTEAIEYTHPTVMSRYLARTWNLTYNPWRVIDGAEEERGAGGAG